MTCTRSSPSSSRPSRAGADSAQPLRPEPHAPLPGSSAGIVGARSGQPNGTDRVLACHTSLTCGMHRVHALADRPVDGGKRGPAAVPAGKDRRRACRASDEVFDYDVDPTSGTAVALDTELLSGCEGGDGNELGDVGPGLLDRGDDRRSEPVEEDPEDHRQARCPAQPSPASPVQSHFDWALRQRRCASLRTRRREGREDAAMWGESWRVERSRVGEPPFRKRLNCDSPALAGRMSSAADRRVADRLSPGGGRDRCRCLGSAPLPAQPARAKTRHLADSETGWDE